MRFTDVHTAESSPLAVILDGARERAIEPADAHSRCQAGLLTLNRSWDLQERGVALQCGHESSGLSLALGLCQDRTQRNDRGTSVTIESGPDRRAVPSPEFVNQWSPGLHESEYRISHYPVKPDDFAYRTVSLQVFHSANDAVSD